MILSRRPNDDDSRDGFTKWPFMTTHTWGEDPRGRWTLEVKTMDLFAQLHSIKNALLISYRSVSIPPKVSSRADGYVNGL
jgi:proprotein convertase subtilisin/kexin type 2